MNQKTCTEIEVQNPMGKIGHMLVVYHPGLSTFPRTIISKFVEGAISRDWKVTISIFSDRSPKNLNGYDLVAFLSPGYGGVPQKDFTAYVLSLDLKQKPCVAMICSGGGADMPTNHLKTQIQTANGVVVAQGSYAQLEPKPKTQNAAYQLGSNQSLIEAIKK